MTDREHDRHYAPSATVRRAIENAQILLTYAAQHKADLDRDAVKTVIDAQNALQQNAWSPEQESFFWQAFTTINRQIKPVTIGSLKAATDKRFFLFRLMSKARLSVHLYRILTAGLLTVLIVMQVYWLIGAGLVAEIDSLTKEKEQVFALEKVKREKLGQNNALENGSGLDLKPVSVEESRLARELETNYNGLLEWSRAWQKLIKQDKNKTFEGKNVSQNQKLVQEKISRLQRRIEMEQRLGSSPAQAEERADIEERIAEKQQQQRQLQRQLEIEKIEYRRIITRTPSEFALEVLQSYILPLLYGLLGAAIYVLRSLTREIEQVTYTSSSDIEYGLRLALGALGGLGIGWFLTPEEFSGIQSISPLALSFLTGYHIDLLFSVMDKFIAAFSRSRPS